jgi:hypothetical protein
VTRRSFSERLLTIVEGLVAFDPQHDFVRRPMPLIVEDGVRKITIQDPTATIAVAGFSMIFSGCYWAVLFDEFPLLDSEGDSDPTVDIDGKEVDIEDLPDDVVRTYLLLQARRYIDSMNRQLESAGTSC